MRNFKCRKTSGEGKTQYTSPVEMLPCPSFWISSPAPFSCGTFWNSPESGSWHKTSHKSPHHLRMIKIMQLVMKMWRARRNWWIMSSPVYFPVQACYFYKSQKFGLPLGGGMTSSMSLGLVRFQSFLMITFSSSFCWSMGPERDKSNKCVKVSSTLTAQRELWSHMCV